MSVYRDLGVSAVRACLIACSMVACLMPGAVQPPWLSRHVTIGVGQERGEGVIGYTPAPRALADARVSA